MPRLRDRSIGFTLTLAFAIGLFLMAVLVGLTLYQIEETRHYRDVLVDEIGPAIDKTEDVEFGIHRLNDLVLIRLFSSVPGDTNLLAETDQALGRDLAELLRYPRVGEEEATTETLRQSVVQMRQLARDVLDRKSRFGSTAAEMYYQGNMRPLLEPAVKDAVRLQKQRSLRLDEIRDRLSQRGDHLAVYLILGFLGSAVASIVLARATVGMVTVPARRLVMAARVLERGEYDRAIDLGAVATAETTEPVNEIERLRQSFVQMARRLQEREDRLLQQARHLEATNSRLAALQSITDVALTRLELDDMLRTLLERAVQATSARGGAVLLKDGAGLLAARVTCGMAPAAAAALFNDPRAGWARWLEGSPEALRLSAPESAARIPTNLPGDYRIGSIVVLPLTAGGQPIGLAHVDAPEPAQFGEDTVALMQVCSERMALAIERARAFAALEDWNQTLEQRIAEQQERLLRSERLASIGLVGAGIAHELRNPLGVITNSVYFLRQRLRGSDEKVMRHAEIIEREVAHAVRIIDSLVQFSQQSAPSAYPVDLPAVFTGMLDRIRTPASVHLEVDLPEDLPRVQADEQRLVQVLENLIRNAIQAMDGVGTVALAAVPLGDSVSLQVRDSGPGIPDEYRGRIFEPLFTTKAKGMGLGLALSQKMVEAWGGTIHVDCPPAGGTVFEIALPAAPPLAIAAAAKTGRSGE